MKLTKLAVIGIALTVLLVLNFDRISEIASFFSNQDLLRSTVYESGLAAPFIILAIHFVHVILAMLPGQPVILAVGYIMGPYLGFLLNWLSIVAASQVAYLLSRRFGRPLVEKFVPEKMLIGWDKASGRHSFSFFLVVFLLPILPGDSINYLAGLTTLAPLPFFIANLLGRAPQMFLLTYVGASGVDIIEGGLSFPQVIIALVLIGILLLISKGVSNRFFSAE